MSDMLCTGLVHIVDQDLGRLFFGPLSTVFLLYLLSSWYFTLQTTHSVFSTCSSHKVDTDDLISTSPVLIMATISLPHPFLSFLPDSAQSLLSLFPSLLLSDSAPEAKGRCPWMGLLSVRHTVIYTLHHVMPCRRVRVQITHTANMESC